MSQSQPVDLQGVVFLRRELAAAGYSDAAIAANVRSGLWHRVRFGAYVAGDLWRSLSVADRHRVLCRAVLRTSHPTAVLSHVSSVIERGGPVWGVPLTHVHTTRADGRGGRRESGKAPHRGVLPPEHVEIVNGVPVTIAARSAVEVTTMTDVESALVSVNALLHDRAMTLEEFSGLAHDLRYWPRSLSTDLVLRLANPLVESAGESRVDYMCFTQHLPRPSAQVVITDEQGRAFARVDFAWPEFGVFLEFDGREKYARFRRAGETLEAFLMREKSREERICQLTGWVCLRIGWADLDNPSLIASRIRRMLESRRPLGA
ncbi:type IV toxin-antitoxin system AbiEi family antitoxin domain-containing protein [Nocardioides sp. LHG3406-4]|uniref:type IV toxin-antitoxin system AbiEi family antitoxin domain-containing protein n=1 Tax=Nocardioides sp. LHG3406-4 TaxID=2804575 RepID=UPI003CF34285